MLMNHCASEPLPIEKNKGDEVIAGTKNGRGFIFLAKKPALKLSWPASFRL